MTTEDLIKLADAYAKVGDSADISLIKHHRSALKSALEALGREVARLDKENQNLSNQLGDCDRARLALAAELAAIRAQEPVAETMCDCYPDHGGTIYAEAVLPSGTPLYASPADKDAGLVADGWQWVPVEPTPEMIHAVRFAGDPGRPAIGERIVAGETAFPFVGADVALRMCRAMLTASPKIGGV